MRRFIPWFFAATVLLAGAVPSSQTRMGRFPREGFAQVEGGPVWYRIYGSGKGIPLLIVHGGPGDRSCIYEPLAEILGKDRPVIIYDQLGTGRSGRPTDSTLWNLERFIRELSQVRSALGLKKVHLMGHSWGGTLVAAYLTRAKPKGVESVIFAGALLNTKLWLEDAKILLSELPKDIQATLKRHEEAGTVQSKEYQEAAEIFYNRFLYHKPKPRLPAICGEAHPNGEIYLQMWGPSEFSATGSLRDFDVTPDLSNLKMPVLFVVGRFDEARPETASRFQAMIPGARLEVVEDCGHMAPLEDPKSYARILNSFFGTF